MLDLDSLIDWLLDWASKWTVCRFIDWFSDWNFLARVQKFSVSAGRLKYLS